MTANQKASRNRRVRTRTHKDTVKLMRKIGDIKKMVENAEWLIDQTEKALGPGIPRALNQLAAVVLNEVAPIIKAAFRKETTGNGHACVALPIGDKDLERAIAEATARALPGLSVRGAIAGYKALIAAWELTDEEESKLEYETLYRAANWCITKAVTTEPSGFAEAEACARFILLLDEDDIFPECRHSLNAALRQCIGAMSMGWLNLKTEMADAKKGGEA